MHLTAFWYWLRARQRLLVYVLGSSFVTVWTLLRFFTQRTIFDLVSQQVIVHQWLHGAMSVARMGNTAYVPKMLLLYAPLDVLSGSPRLKLILLTVVINITSFIVIGLIIERILREFGVRITGAFYGGLLFLSAIAGSVFWIEFANSRNLEVAGGLFCVLLGLRLLQSPNWRLAIGLALFGGVLFFDDPLQFYMCALPLLAYAGLAAIVRQERVRHAAYLIGAVAAGYLIAQTLFLAAGHYLKVSFKDTGSVSPPQLSLAWLMHSVSGTLHAALGLLAGAGDAGMAREIVNLGLLAAGAAAFAYTCAKRLAPRRLMALLASIVAVDILIYIGSGQAVQGSATARYLIMLAPVVVIALSTVRLPKLHRPYAHYLVAVALTANLVTLGGALFKNWNTNFPQDSHIESTFRYTAAHPAVQVYASIDTAMALQYYHHAPAATSLPLGCLGGSLVRTHFSMEQAFAAAVRQPDVLAAIVFDGPAITNTPNVCTPETVIKQFGPPFEHSQTDDGSAVLLYRQASLRLPG